MSYKTQNTKLRQHREPPLKPEGELRLGHFQLFVRYIVRTKLFRGGKPGSYIKMISEPVTLSRVWKPSILRCDSGRRSTSIVFGLWIDVNSLNH